MIKVVCLDLDGVLFQKAHSNLVKNLADKFNLDVKLIEDVLFRRAPLEGRYNDLKKGKIDFVDYLKWLCLVLKVNITKEEYLDILINGYELNPEAIELINQLHRMGIKTAVCSNNWKANIENLDKKFKFFRHFDILVFSYDVGFLKPDPEIYKVLINKSKVKPEEIFIADDVAEKMKGAEELGIQCFLYTTFEQYIKDLKSLGVKL